MGKRKSPQFQDSSRLFADVRERLLATIQEMDRRYDELSEVDQGRVIDAVEGIAKLVIRESVDVVSRRGFETVPVFVKDFTVKGGAIKGKFECVVTDTHVISLSSHQEKAGHIVLADPEQFMNGGDPIRPAPDEPLLIDHQPGDAL